jgi:hypothetical protein
MLTNYTLFYLLPNPPSPIFASNPSPVEKDDEGGELSGTTTGAGYGAG